MIHKNRHEVLALSQRGQIIRKPSDAIKDPFILEFLGLAESNLPHETKMEEMLIVHLQNFLLELGKGFAFIGRQERLTLEGDHFYCDLVFYHAILKCYVLIDLLCVASHKSSYVVKSVMWCLLILLTCFNLSASL